jgi:3-isopropylmalate dehydrogenase
VSLKIGILLGDDIGLEVVPECIKVMKAAAARERLEIKWRPLPIGKHGHAEHGNTLPRVTEEGLRELDGWVMGPIGHPAYPRGDATWVMPPVRKKFDLFAAVRPALPCRHSFHSSECGHCLLARAHRGNALFRDGHCRVAGVPAQ